MGRLEQPLMPVDHQAGDQYHGVGDDHASDRPLELTNPASGVQNWTPPVFCKRIVSPVVCESELVFYPLSLSVKQFADNVPAHEITCTATHLGRSPECDQPHTVKHVAAQAITYDDEMSSGTRKVCSSARPPRA